MKVFSIDPMRQLPTLFVVGDLDSRCIYSNDYTANLFVYRDEENMLGISPYDLRCQAVECADEFIAQNQKIIKTGKELTMLDIHYYANEQKKILMTKKYPYQDKGRIMGSICYCIEIDSPRLEALCKKLIQSDKKYYHKRNNKERSYIIGIPSEKNNLTTDESRSIFYLLRGKSIKSKAIRESILEKVNCRNEAEISEYALSNGYLNYIPNNIFTL